MCPFTCELLSVYTTRRLGQGILVSGLLVKWCLFLPSFVTSAFASHLGHLRTSGMVAFSCWTDDV
jgi:hypothetical protein